MSETNVSNPFRGLVSGRLWIYLEQAFVEYERGRIRGSYDYAIMALNATLFELKASGATLFAKLQTLVSDERLSGTVLDAARRRAFLSRHDVGITDMDLSYMTVDQLSELLEFLEMFYRSLRDNGVVLACDPRGQ